MAGVRGRALSRWRSPRCTSPSFFPPHGCRRPRPCRSLLYVAGLWADLRPPGAGGRGEPASAGGVLLAARGVDEARPCGTSSRVLAAGRSAAANADRQLARRACACRRWFAGRLPRRPRGGALAPQPDRCGGQAGRRPVPAPTPPTSTVASRLCQRRMEERPRGVRESVARCAARRLGDETTPQSWPTGADYRAAFVSHLDGYHPLESIAVTLPHKLYVAWRSPL